MTDILETESFRSLIILVNNFSAGNNAENQIESSLDLDISDTCECEQAKQDRLQPENKEQIGTTDEKSDVETKEVDGISQMEGKEFVSHPRTYLENDRRIIEACLIISFCAFPLGWDVGTTGFMVSHQSFTNSYGSLSSLMIGVLISCFNLGCLVGCLTIGQLKMNLKYAIQISLSIYLLGSGVEWLASYENWGLTVYLFGRVFCGVCCGALCVIAPIYTSELIVNESKRGPYLSFFQAQVCGWILLGNLANVLYDRMGQPFLVVIYAKVAFTLLFGISLLRVPNSIKYYLEKKAIDKLYGVYRQIYVNADAELVDREIDYYVPSPSDQGWVSIFKSPNLSKTMICCCLMAFQQLTGINYFFYYGNIIFNSSYSIIIMSVANLVGGLSSGKILQFFQIKTILIAGSFTMSLLMLAYSIFGLIQHTLVNVISPILIVITCLFILCFAVSWGPCCGILSCLISGNSSEIMGLAISVNWIFNFAISIVTPILIAKLEFSYGFIFCFNLLVMGLFVLRFL
ncbi:uncharacterized protein PRCAT00002615001 [Priceomyces carsonii]|uniref:uncharacterized protein n=1 Tax=Priceomyces carsonii TaxID=28549 RepID=UPI002EDAE20B|nr:unnamed protein product [Priceomyces carsonii]